MTSRFSALLLILLTVNSCSDDPAVKPSGLAYAPNQLTVFEGASGASEKPELVGTQPIAFSISSSPAAGEAMTIDTDGTIRFTGELPVGSYVVSVTAENAAGAVEFPAVFTLNVEAAPVAPTALIYSPNRTELVQGTAFISNAPQVEGTLPAEFSILNNPAPDKITIDGSGVIRAMSSLTAGNYPLSIRVANIAGQKDFTDAITLVVQANASAPAALVYSPATVEINQGKTITTAAPSLSGTGPFTFSAISSPIASGITIASNGTVTIAETVQPGTYVVTVSVTNSTGTVSFPTALTVVVKAYTPTTFTKDVRVILQMRCTGCHSNYTDYSVVKNRVDVILDRIQRAKNAIGFMPEGGEPLGPAEIETIKKWKEDGLPQ